MNKAFENFTWENSPSKTTPINASNLMKINNGLNEVDDRVVELNDEVHLRAKKMELTQEQYDSLPESEKYNGTVYFIVD